MQHESSRQILARSFIIDNNVEMDKYDDDYENNKRSRAAPSWPFIVDWVILWQLPICAMDITLQTCNKRACEMVIIIHNNVEMEQNDDYENIERFRGPVYLYL